MSALPSSPLRQPSLEFNLVVVNGSNKGTVFKLNGSKIKLGRGTENEIQFPHDLKCSRSHAQIEFTEQGIILENISDSNHILVDGMSTQRSIIKHGSIFQIGQTELQLVVKQPNSLSLVNSSSSAAPSTFNSTQSNNQFSAAVGVNHSPSKKRTQKDTPIVKIITYSIIIIGLLYFLLTPNKKKDSVEIRTQEIIDAEIEKVKQLKEASVEEKKLSGKNSKQYDEAQTSYLKGFRDYRQGHFGRALDSFQACLSLFPEHELCNRYLKLSKRKYGEITQYHMILGRKYREQGQNAACRASFRNVMVMVVDTNSPIYKEAKANFDTCDALVEDRF